MNYEVGGLPMQNQENRSALQVSPSSYSGSFIVSATIAPFCKQFFFELISVFSVTEGGRPVTLV